MLHAFEFRSSPKPQTPTFNQTYFEIIMQSFDTFCRNIKDKVDNRTLALSAGKVAIHISHATKHSLNCDVGGIAIEPEALSYYALDSSIDPYTFWVTNSNDDISRCVSRFKFDGEPLGYNVKIVDNMRKRLEQLPLNVRTKMEIKLNLSIQQRDLSTLTPHELAKIATKASDEKVPDGRKMLRKTI